MEGDDKEPETVACSDEDHDRLSNLSDELIVHILSFLTTKESYRTCVLSRRWESICTKIPNLDFELPKDGDPMMFQAIQSVYAALLRRTENLRRLSFFSDNGCTPYDIHLWVSKALDLKVRELDLECWSLKQPTLLPLRLSISKSLVVLKLRGGTQPRLDSSFDVYFPSLKILHLQYIVLNSIMDDHSEYDLAKFLSRCPHLEELVLHDCMKQAINIVSFHSLKRLFIYLFMPVAGSNVCPLQLNAPSLEVLSIVDSSFSPRKYEFTNLSNLNRATIQICKHLDYNSLYTILKGLSNVKSLTITSETIHFLSMEDNLDNLHLLTFHNLSFLSVEVSENCSWNILVSLLQNAPKLKDLVIEKCFETEEVGNSGWVGTSESPTCLSNSLITFEFKGIQNIQTELDFTRYIINRSSNLKKVKIFTPSSNKPVERSLLEGSNNSSVLVWDINSI